MSIPADVVEGVVKGVASGLDGLFTSDEERLNATNKALELVMQPHMLQALNNIQDSKSQTWFQSGWRPAIGWLSGFGLFYAWFLRDIVVMILALTGHANVIGYMPTPDTNEISAMVMSLLGLSGLRSWEKFKGVAKN